MAYVNEGIGRQFGGDRHEGVEETRSECDQDCQTKINARKLGSTSLHSAASNGQKEHIDAILGHPHTRVEREGTGVLDMQDKFGRTALMIATEQGHIQCVDLLLSYGADITKVDADRWSCVHFATANSRAEVLCRVLQNQRPEARRTVVNLQTSDGYSALMFAAQAGSADCMKILLQNGSNVHLRNNEGESVFDILLFSPEVLYSQ